MLKLHLSNSWLWKIWWTQCVGSYWEQKCTKCMWQFYQVPQKHNISLQLWRCNDAGQQHLNIKPCECTLSGCSLYSLLDSFHWWLAKIRCGFQIHVIHKDTLSRFSISWHALGGKTWRQTERGPRKPAACSFFDSEFHSVFTSELWDLLHLLWIVILTVVGTSSEGSVTHLNDRHWTRKMHFVFCTVVVWFSFGLSFDSVVW